MSSVPDNEYLYGMLGLFLPLHRQVSLASAGLPGEMADYLRENYPNLGPLGRGGRAQFPAEGPTWWVNLETATRAAANFTPPVSVRCYIGSRKPAWKQNFRGTRRCRVLLLSSGEALVIERGRTARTKRQHARALATTRAGRWGGHFLSRMAGLAERLAPEGFHVRHDVDAPASLYTALASGIGGFGALHIDRCLVSRTGVLVLLLGQDDDGQELVLRQPVRTRAARRVQANADNLLQLQGHWGGLRVPRLLARSPTEQIPWTLEERLPGVNAAEASHPWQLVDQALASLARHLDTRCHRRELGMNDLETVLAPEWQGSEALLGEGSEAAEGLRQGLVRTVLGTVTAVGPCHGDFKLENMNAGLGGLIGLYDLDHYRAEGLPVLDLLHLLFSMEVAEGRRDNVMEVVLERLEQDNWSEQESRCLADAPGLLPEEKESRRGWLVLYAVNHLVNRQVDELTGVVYPQAKVMAAGLWRVVKGLGW